MGVCMSVADKRRLTIPLTKSDYTTLQEMKDDEGIVQDTEMIVRLLHEQFIKYRIKKTN